ncbi:hypothetical protein [Streptomyces tsukubensis]|uniref:hypothetical protein n=1 Tax=Streptomyces tsukubensis TaxID=83656 RepID=UPI00344E43FD
MNRQLARALISQIHVTHPQGQCLLQPQCRQGDGREEGTQCTAIPRTLADPIQQVVSLAIRQQERFINNGSHRGDSSN